MPSEVRGSALELLGRAVRDLREVGVRESEEWISPLRLTGAAAGAAGLLKFGVRE